MRIRHVVVVSLVGVLLGRPAPGQEPPAPFPVTIRVDASASRGDWRPVWRYFGHDEPNYTYAPDGRRLLGQLAELGPEPVFVRTHNLLTSGDGSSALKWGSTGVYTEDADGRPRYDWTILDRIFDVYRDAGVKPLVQIGFMPEALSTHPVPYRHEWTPGGKASISTGWAYPPKDYNKWGELVYRWVHHEVERYGRAEVETWWWEVWNEPNILYWRGTPEEFHKLYDYAADAVKRALPTARIGGPHVAGSRTDESNRFLKGFLDHCLRGTNYATGKTGTPLDFVAFHAKGSPRFLDNHVQTGIASQLQDIDRGFATVAAEPLLKGKPIIIGESDPDGCAACPSTVYPQNGYRNGTLYASYTAASFARKIELADQHGVNFEGAVTWAFEFEDQPYFAGFRVLSTNGVGLPVLNVFRMFGLLGGQRVAAESSGAIPLKAIEARGVRAQPDVAALATREGDRVAVLVWHHHDDDLAGPDADVSLSLAGLVPARAMLLSHYRIDASHGNAFTAWQKLGSPAAPTPDQKATLLQTSGLTLWDSPRWLHADPAKEPVRFRLPRQAVSLLVFEATPSAK